MPNKTHIKSDIKNKKFYLVMSNLSMAKPVQKKHNAIYNKYKNNIYFANKAHIVNDKILPKGQIQQVTCKPRMWLITEPFTKIKNNENIKIWIKIVT